MEQHMWYFSWILGIGVALAFGIINAMWFEAHRETQQRVEQKSPGQSTRRHGIALQKSRSA
jgi:cytochrome bd-I ubiquinol oxidase subunit X